MADKVSSFPGKTQQDHGVAPGGGGPHDPGMEARMTRLEDQFSRIEVLLRSLDDRMRGLEDRMRALEVGAAELRGRVASLPTTWAMIATVIGGQVAMAGLMLGAFRLGIGH